MWTDTGRQVYQPMLAPAFMGRLPPSTGNITPMTMDAAADAGRLNIRWWGDITYIPTGGGWLCLATVIDIASRRVTGHAMAGHLRTELAADALAKHLHVHSVNAAGVPSWHFCAAGNPDRRVVSLQFLDRVRRCRALRPE
jgi:transposase InsO family protein